MSATDDGERPERPRRLVFRVLFGLAGLYLISSGFGIVGDDSGWFFVVAGAACIYFAAVNYFQGDE